MLAHCSIQCEFCNLFCCISAEVLSFVSIQANFLWHALETEVYLCYILSCTRHFMTQLWYINFYNPNPNFSHSKIDFEGAMNHNLLDSDTLHAYTQCLFTILVYWYYPIILSNTKYHNCISSLIKCCYYYYW